jgi:hypothetical protein
MRLLGIVRLSDGTGETTSPEWQRGKITGYASLHGHTLVAEAEDLDVSGSVSPFKRADPCWCRTDPLTGRWPGYGQGLFFRSPGQRMALIHPDGSTGMHFMSNEDQSGSRSRHYHAAHAMQSWRVDVLIRAEWHATEGTYASHRGAERRARGLFWSMPQMSCWRVVAAATPVGLADATGVPAGHAHAHARPEEAPGDEVPGTARRGWIGRLA